MDTTIPEPPPATLSGELSYPSDYMPQDMKVCAESLSSGASHCGAQFHESGRRRLYRLSVPAGRYRVYALTAETPNYRAYYTDAVPCGLSVECTSHKPIIVGVEAGETKEGIDPADWYAGD